MEKARNIRRAAKGSLTRTIGTVRTLIEANRPWEEVQDAAVNITKSFEGLVEKHEEFTLLLNDEEYEEAEIWMDVCTREFNNCNMFANDYVRDSKKAEDAVNDKQPEDLNVNVDEVINENPDENVNPENVNAENEDMNVNAQENPDENVNPENVNAENEDMNVNAQNINVGNVNAENGINVNIENVNAGNVNTGNEAAGNEAAGSQSAGNEAAGSQSAGNQGVYVNQKDKDVKRTVSVSLRHEKAKLPVFNGDVRKYFIFKDDFKHAIESKCTERDSITILRSCLGPEPSKLIEGISSDLETVWKYLNQIYGDPRIVSDVVTSDLERFKPIQPGEDHHFCELVNLVRRSYNILKEIKRPQDIDNTHVISLIERKLTKDDQKIWARSINQQKIEPSMNALLEWMEVEMSARIRSSAVIRKSVSNAPRPSVNAVTTPSNQRAVNNNPSYQPQERNNRFNKVSYQSHDSPNLKSQCFVCQGQHYVDECPRFKKMAIKEHWKVVKDKHACFCCLKFSKDHTAMNCRRRKDCGEIVQGTVCNKSHHKLLHMNEERVGVSFVQDNSTALLPVIIGIVKGEQESKTEVNVFYDSGAQVSMIRSGVAESMGLKGKRIKIYLTKVGGIEEELDTKMYKVPLYTRNNTAIQSIQAIGIPQISDDIADININVIASKFNVDLKRKAGPIDVLVGINYPSFHVGETRVKDGLVARQSPLGWVVFGVNAEESVKKPKQVLHVRLASPIDLTDFWKTESMGVAVQPCTCEAAELSKEERMELNLIEKSCKRDGNKWLMSYPWKRDPNLLPNNYDQVLKKLESTERRLRKNTHHAESYDKQIKEMEDMGFARKMTQEELKSYNGPVHYISHHAVVRPEKKSTPVRIVFNSSATYKGHTLNGYWYKGPDLLNSLFGVILRFRENPVAVCADISKMYHRVTIPIYDQQVHRFLWRSLEEREPDTYVNTVLTFGDRPSPAMAIVALRKTAELNAANEPKAAESITKNTYMDDICDSVDTAAEADKLTTSIDSVLSTGGFKVKGWTSNVSKQQHSQEITIGNEEESEKILGVVWSPKEDKFSYKVNIDTTTSDETKSKSLTKRNILSHVAGIFDPIGAGAAVLVKAKIAMQELWQHGLDWDDEVPDEIKEKWRELFKELAALNGFDFDRCLKPSNVTEDPWLIVFCDASRLAFGACAYVRWKLASGKFEVRFIAAKTRVSPLKQLSIPRLELQGAVLAGRLAKTICEQSRFKFSRSVYFTDSLVVLAWIQSQSRCYKPFVSCRIGEIQSNSEPAEWMYCPTELNVADDLTKGIPTKDLNGRWMNGPTFLQMPESQWPRKPETVDMTETNKERRKPLLVQAATVKEPVLKCEDFSSWKRLLRVTTYVLRFIQNCRKSTQEKSLGPLTPDELAKAEDYWIRKAQSSLHQRLQRGDLASLTPFMNGNGIIKVGGRVDPSLISYDNQHATLLPYGHWISTLITRDAHQYGHNGVATTTAKVRKKYWIIKGNSISKKVKRQCTFCRKMEARVSSQFMSDLPQCRQQPYTPPFLYSSCDYFGPVKVKIGRNKTTKHYGVIFTCLNTRAVHCELATDASSMELLQVLRRFFAQRGYPKLLLSDNGTQMVGADRELREMIEGWDVKELKEYCADRSMTWQFITPLAPHQNGCAESMVKSVKKALKKAIGDTVLTPFELHTCLLEAANLVNQRPIGRIPNDPNDGSYLCPNDILLGRCSSTVPQGPFRETKNPRHRFEFCQRIVDSFWKVWSRDVLPALNQRKKWQTKNRNAQVGDYIAFIKEDSDVRGKWNTGVIDEVYPGNDGLVRNVNVRTADGIYKRPITKISVIYPIEGLK